MGLTIGPSTRLTPELIAEAARGWTTISLDRAAYEAIDRSRAVVDRLLAGDATIYGVTTGFGDLARVPIDRSDARALQVNLVRSHAAGTGEPLARDIVRAMILLRAHALALGYSGVRVEVVEALCGLFNVDIVPLVPSRGSVGASGDLAPLAHVAQVLIGEGFAWVDGEIVAGDVALRGSHLRPVVLEAKEGLALLNGTQLMVSCASLGLVRGLSLVDHADLVGAMTLEALQGTAVPFAEVVHNVRPHPGQRQSAANLRRWCSGSQIGLSHRDTNHRIQDPYSLRCMPQVHGAVRDTLDHLRRVTEIEMNAATDNPLVFPPSDVHPDGAVISAGNFHGEPIAIATDAAKIALIELASISERRTARLVDASLSDGLPAFLSPEAGLHSGLMVLQYTAAALINELQSLGHPNSIHSLPTSANQEDHVSMGGGAALALLEVVDRTQRVLAIEAICAAQGLDLRRPLLPGPSLVAAQARLRSVVEGLDADRSPAPDIESAVTMIRAGGMLDAAMAVP